MSLAPRNACDANHDAESSNPGRASQHQSPGMSMKNLALIVIKVALTIPVAYALAYPFLNPAADGGVFKEVETLGVFASLVLVATFLAAVFLYCRDLYRCLSLVSPGARKASPRSVWLMFLIPYNFVEDFFIVANVAGSLRQEAVGNAALHRFKSFGMASGLGWCAAQIVSLLPHSIGSIAGALAVPLWIAHWRLIRQINAALSEALNPAGSGVGQRV